MLVASLAVGSAGVVVARSPAGDEEFTLDLRVTVSAPAGAAGRPDSDDGCSSTCELSNCVTESADPS
jgi:FxLD family lantipeptide